MDERMLINKQTSNNHLCLDMVIKVEYQHDLNLKQNIQIVLHNSKPTY